MKAQVRIRQDGIKRKFEEAVHRASSGIDCGNAGKGVRTTYFFFVLAQIYRRNVDLPVPAFPVRKTDCRYIG